jgi:hypothetical protein
VRWLIGSVLLSWYLSNFVNRAYGSLGAAENLRNVQRAAHGTQQVSPNVTDVQRGN